VLLIARDSFPHYFQAVAVTHHIDPSPLLLKQQQRLAEFFQIGDPQQRLARVVHEASKRPTLDSTFRLETNRVEGCLVRVWFVPEFRAGKCFFRCDSDAVSLKAIGGLICDLYSGHSPEEISATNSGVLKHVGILTQLAENRQRTIARIEEKIRHFAQEHQTKVV
jgi:cysteine desulfuration protein SufE